MRRTLKKSLKHLCAFHFCKTEGGAAYHCSIPLSFIGSFVCFILSKYSCSMYFSTQHCHLPQHLPPISIRFPRSSSGQSHILAGADSAHGELQSAPSVQTADAPRTSGPLGSTAEKVSYRGNEISLPPARPCFVLSSSACA